MSDVIYSEAASAVPTPSAGYGRVFYDSADLRWKVKDANGVITQLARIGATDQNLLDNGGMMIQQRVATASTAIAGVSTTTRAGVVADRWAVTTSVATNLNWAQIDSAGATETSLLSRYYGSIIASTAGKKVMLSQFILNSRMAHVRGGKVRVSVKTSQKVGSAQTLHLGLLQLTSAGTVDVCPAFLTGAWSTTTGTDPAWGTNLSPIVPDAAPVGENGTISGNWLNITTQSAWLRSSTVFTVPATAKNLVVVLFSDATGGTTDNLSVTECQLTQGPDVVDFVQVPLDVELVRCQRFFCKSFPLTVVPAASVSEATGGSGITAISGKTTTAALAANFRIQFPVTMWKAPTVTYFTPTSSGAQVWRFSGAAAAAFTATATRTNSITDNGCVVTATGDASNAVGDLVGVHYTADSEFVS